MPSTMEQLRQPHHSSDALSPHETFLGTKDQDHCSARDPQTASPGSLFSCKAHAISARKDRHDASSPDASSSSTRTSSSPPDPYTSDLSSPLLKRRPSHPKRSQISAHRIAIRRIISASHHHHHHHHLQPQPEKSNAPSPPCPPLQSLSSPSFPSASTPSRLGAVTEAILQDQLPLYLHCTGRLNHWDSVGDRSCSRSRYQSAVSPTRPRIRVPDPSSTSLSSHCPSASSPCLLQTSGNVPITITARRSCVSLPFAPQRCSCHSRNPLQGRSLCSSSSTAELQSSVPMYPFFTQNHTTDRPKLLSRGRGSHSPTAQTGASTALSASCPWPSLRTSLSSQSNNSPGRREGGRRRSASDAVWMRLAHPKEKILARLRSGSAADLYPLPERASNTAWPPVTALVTQGLTDSKRSADLYEQYRETSWACDHGQPCLHTADNLIKGLEESAMQFSSPLPEPPAFFSTAIVTLPFQMPSSSQAMGTNHLSLSPQTIKDPQAYPNESRHLHHIAAPHLHQSFRLHERSRRRRVGEDISTQRRPTARHLATTRLTRRDTELRNLELSRQRRQSAQRFARYLAAKPLPLVRLMSRSRAEHAFEASLLPRGSVNKALPPVPAPGRLVPPGGDPIDKACVLASVPGSNFYHQAFSTMTSPDDDGSKARREVHPDLHPLTDGSEKKEVMQLEQELPSPPLQLSTAGELERSTMSAFIDPSFGVTVPSPRRLDSFRFPMKKTPIDKNAITRPRLHLHMHHQSLPYSTTHSHLLSKALDVYTLSSFDILYHTRSNSVISASTLLSPVWVAGPGAGCGETVKLRTLLEHDKNTVRVTSRTRDKGSDRRRRQSTQRLKRSESCSRMSHRPSLSFNSSKKALLSLQDRRINKPDAKIHRLPDIQTGASGNAANGTVRDVGRSGPTDTDPWTYASHILKSSKGECGTSKTRFETEAAMLAMTDYQLRVSLKDRVTIESILTEDTTITVSRPDVKPEQDHGDRNSVDGEYTRTTQGDVGARMTESQDVNPIATNSALESTLCSALGAFTIDPRPVIDAGEIKRFVKRSHALLELETTEEGYVNDLDILMHVYMRVLETRSWFPQSILAKMRRCVSGLLTLHREFYSRLEANKVGESDRERQAPLRVYRNLVESFKSLHQENHLYSTFCELRMRTVKEINRSAGQATLTLLQKESKDLMAQQGRPVSRADLKDFLIKPIQRVCRYPLLLKEILRLTSVDDSEYQFIDQAYQLMKEKAREMDETQRAVERKLLTEQFLKKLPESSLPRKTGSSSSKEHSTVGATNGEGYNIHSHSSSHHQPCTTPFHFRGGSPGIFFDAFDFGASQEGVAPAGLTTTFVGTLGSIVLAGALEYVITPDTPIRLKYYGCFLFESMLIVVKAKKSSLYEPRQWLPLRLCELHETNILDGYTRFGWRIMFDQFRIDFGASSAAEQQVWVTTLRDRIQIAKDAYSKLPRDIAAFETIVSSLPWKLSKSQNLGLASARHLQISHQSPSPSPSPWSSCSSTIPSPLMPPPPSASSSTMMMAVSSMVTMESEKWNARGSGPHVDSYAYNQDNSLQPPSSEQPQYEFGLKCTEHTRQSSTADHERVRIGGMAGNWVQDNYQGDQGQGPTSSHSVYQSRHAQDPRPESSSHLLYPSTPVPWLMPEGRSRTHSFDVTRVFTSSNSGIKPNQRTLVQSMFKDVSTENIWTTTTTFMSQPSPQPTSALSRYGSASPLGYFQSMTMSTSMLSVNGDGQLVAASDGMSLHPLPPLNDENDAPAQPIGSPSSSLTSRLLRRHGSGIRARPLSSSGTGGPPEKSEWDRRRSSATAAIAGTLSLNFRKNSDPQQDRQLHHRHQPSSPQRAVGDSERISVKARAQMIEKKASSSQEVFGLMAPSQFPFRKNKAGSQSHKGQALPVTYPMLTIQGEGSKEIMDTLNSAAEAARTRRGNSERASRIQAGYTLTSSSSSRSLPTMLRSANSSTHSFSVLPTSDAPKDNNAERIWSAMGRMMPKRSGGSGQNRTSRSRAPSNSSCSSQLGENILFSLPSCSPNREPLQRHGYDNDDQESPFSSSTSMGSTPLQRSSTNGSRSTTTSYTSTPSMAPSLSSPKCSEQFRTDFEGTSQSVDSDSSQASSTLPRLALMPSVSLTSCASETSPEYSTSLLVPNKPSLLQRPGSGGNPQICNKEVINHGPNPSQYRPQDSHALEQRPGGGQAQASAGSLSPQERRKSLSILQNLTHSASQRFRILMRSPSGLRRRTVMNLSPITMEQSSCSGEATDEGEQDEDEALPRVAC